MQVEQIKKLREYHDAYDMCVFRTEGLYHHERGDFSFLIWDDGLGVCHSINTNPDNYLYQGQPVKIDSFDYEAITGIYSPRDLKGLEDFLNVMKNKNLIQQKDFDEIMKVYNDQFGEK